MLFNTERISKYEAAFLGSKDAEKLLKKASDRYSHCLLIQSEDSLLSDVFLYVLFKKILNADGADFSNRLLSNNIPDIIVLPRNEKVSTEDVEFIVQTAYLTPIELDTKIYVIDKCETMNETAQNKLLKLLEEPPPSCKFILKCNSKFALLPTVLSRSEIIEIRPISSDAILNVLPSATTERQRALIAATCFGKLDYAEKVLFDGNFILLEDLVFEIFSEMKRSSDLAKVAYKILKFKDYIDTVIFFIECLLHDCMVCSQGEIQRVYFRHRERELMALCKEYTVDATIGLSKKIMHARHRIKHHGNITAIMDELLFSILEEKVKWQKL